MEPRRFQLEGPSLDALKAQVLAEHGPRARIIAAEKVTVGGIGGFLARHHYEVTVELPPRGRRAAPVDADLPSRAGIGALLARAEEAGSSKAANIVLMGRVAKYFDIPYEKWIAALEKTVAEKFIDLNKKAFALGYNA